MGNNKNLVSRFLFAGDSEAWKWICNRLPQFYWRGNQQIAL